jgi:hypothetical protein
MRKEQYLYEVLVRGARDGTLSAAHVIRAETVIDDDGTVLSERMLPAEALPVAEISDVLGEEFATLAKDNVDLRQQLAEPKNEDPLPVLSVKEISDRQFAQGLAIAGLITEAEALAWVKTGELPLAVEGFVSTLPEKEAFSARMILSGATMFDRTHPLAMAFAAATGLDLEQFWAVCAAL